MDQYVTGAVIKELRRKRGLTQAELAERLCVSDKSVSKWETGKGYPDVSLLEPIARVFGVSVTELISGNAVRNANTSANVLRSVVYVCPVCGNIFSCMGEAVVQCHGVQLMPCRAEEPDDRHAVHVETVEDELYVYLDHDMSKTHYISFIAALSGDRLQLVKLYPEGGAQARFQISGVSRLLYYCNRDGLFAVDVRKQLRRA